MKIKSFIGLANKIASLEFQEDWDNSGYQIVFGDEEIKGILIALDLTDEVIEEAKFKDVNLIVTHHPLIFGGISKIDESSSTGRHIMKLIKNGISVYSLHTPFDKSVKGNSAYLARMLSLDNLRGINDFCMTGNITSEITLKGFVKYCAEELSIPKNAVRYIGEDNDVVKSVAICAGSGAEFIDEVKAENIDLYITGDIKYHDAMRAKLEGLKVIDLGHYGTEKFFIANFYDQLENELDLIGDYIPMYEFIEYSDPYKFVE